MLIFRIILVEPMYSGNIGSVARVMKNLGFKELILVNPCELDFHARQMAMHAFDIIENSKIVSSIKEAVQDSNLIVGTTGLRGKHIRMPALTPSQLREKLANKNGVISIVFGRENDGLRNHELKLCDLIVSIPTSKEYPSMNLSHAIAIVLYELSKVEGGDITLAKHSDLELLYKHLDEVLEDIEYKQHKKHRTKLMLRRILGRAELTEGEVQTLRGVLRSIQWKLRKQE